MGNEAYRCGVTSIRDTCSCSKIDAKRVDQFLQAEAQGRRMFWLIKSDLAATGKPHLRN
jgi:hypothetical protein